MKCSRCDGNVVVLPNTELKGVQLEFVCEGCDSRAPFMFTIHTPEVVDFK
jgi:hypothetical protein